MFVEMPGDSHSKSVSKVRGYRTLDEVKARVQGQLWHKVNKIYEVYPDQEPRRLLKKELLELGALDD